MYLALQPEGLSVSVDLKDIMLSKYDYQSDEDIVEAVREGESEALEF